MYSDSECALASSRSTRSVSSSLIRHRNKYVYGHGSNRDLSRIPVNPTMHDILNNSDMLKLFVDYLSAYGKKALGEFCVVILGLSDLKQQQQEEEQSTGNNEFDKKLQLYGLLTIIYKQFIENKQQQTSLSWMKPETREQLKKDYQSIKSDFKQLKQVYKQQQQYSVADNVNNDEQFKMDCHEYVVDPSQLFAKPMADLILYLKHNFYSNFLSSNLWRNYCNEKLSVAAAATTSKGGYQQQKQQLQSSLITSSNRPFTPKK